MRKLVAVCIERPVFAAMIVLSLVVIGGASYFRLGVDRFPRIDLPQASVRTNLPGAAVEEVETQITEPIEEAVNTVEGINSVRSTSGSGASYVGVVFNLDREYRRRDPGSPRSRLGCGAQPAGRDVAAGRPQVQQRRGRVDVDRALGHPVGAGADGDRRQDRQTAAGALVGRWRGADRRRARADHQHLGRCRSAGGVPHADYGDPDRARAPEPGCARRQRDGRSHRAAAAHHRADHRSGGVQRPGHQERRRGADPHPRHRPCRGRHQGAALDRPAQRRADGRARDPASDRVEHDRGDRRGEAEPRDRQDGDPARRQHRDHPRPVALHQRGAARDRPAPDPRRHPRLARRLCLHARLAVDHHRRPRHPVVGHRHVRDDGGARLHDEQRDDAGAGADGGDRHRQRDRGAGEHLPVHRGEAAVGVRGGARGDGGDRAAGVRHHALPRRHLHSRLVHVERVGARALPVRADGSRRHPGVAGGLVHADADDERAPAAAVGRPRWRGEVAAGVLRRDRPRLHGHAAVFAAPSRRGGRARRGRDCLELSALHRRPPGVHSDQRRRGRVRARHHRARGDEPGGDGRDHARRRARRAQRPRRQAAADHGGRQFPRHRQQRAGVRPHRAARGAGVLDLAAGHAASSRSIRSPRSAATTASAT